MTYTLFAFINIILVIFSHADLALLEAILHILAALLRLYFMLKDLPYYYIPLQKFNINLQVMHATFSAVFVIWTLAEDLHDISDIFLVLAALFPFSFKLGNFLFEYITKEVLSLDYSSLENF